jgi:uncharacterized phosphosugar-binding protein
MDIIREYLSAIKSHLDAIERGQRENVASAAKIVADRIAEDELIYVYGPGGHSNLGTQEVFFRAGGLMHINPILDEGTLISSGALRSMAMERLPGYGRIVMEQSGFGGGDVIVLVNAYGINAALIDAAMYCKEVGGTVIAVSSESHANKTSPDHPARHPSKKNLSEFADVLLDCGVEPGDAVLRLEGIPQKVGAISTFANAYLLNSLMMSATQILETRGIVPPIWRSGNVEGGDEWNGQFIDRFRHRIPCL